MKKKRMRKKLHKKKKDQFNLNIEYKICWDFLKKSKNYIFFVIILFLIFGIVGYFLHDVVNILYKGVFGADLGDVILTYIEDLILETQGMSQKELIGFIFLNNFQSSVSGILLGAVYGILPFFATVINGYLLGFVANLSVQDQGVLVLWRILPHGIFELPAIFVALGLGLKIGDYFFRKSENFLVSLLYLFLTFLVSVIGFGVVVGIFGIVSILVSGGPFVYNFFNVSESSILFFIFLVIYCIFLLLGLFLFNKKEKEKIRLIIINVLKVVLLVIFPLLIIAAIIEGTLIVLGT